MRYLDPKHDLVFKKVFGHANLLQSFLNALLPLSSPIESLEYLPAEMVPEIPVLKHSIVDVRCRDQNGRQFIVEMQMLWTDSFKSRVLFNASKAYVRQIDKTEDYESLEPVFSLNLVNQSFEKDTAEFYHHYAIVHLQDSGKRLHGLEFVFVELPKFRPEKVLDQPMADQAVAAGKRIGVIATLGTTLEPTADLILRRAQSAGKQIELTSKLCAGAFDALMNGDAAKHDAIVAAALKELSQHVDVVVLAQASMARVVETLAAADKQVPILASPGIAVDYLATVLLPGE